MTTENTQETTDTSEQTTTEEQPTTQEDSSSLQSKENEVELDFVEPDFSGIVEFVESDGEEPLPVETVSEETTEPSEETPTEEVAEPVVEAAEESEEAPVVEPEKVEAKPEEEEIPPVEAAEEPEAVPEIKVPTKEELEGMYKDHREQTLPTLENLYQLTEEEAAAVDEAPSKILPKLAARLQYDAMLSSYNATLAALPSVVNRLIQANKDMEAAQGQFFEQWPDLNTPKAKPVVSAAIHAYRAAHPRASVEDIIKQSGVMAMINMGLDPLPKPEAETKPAVKTMPAKPAAPRGAPAAPPPKANTEEENPFSELADMWDRDNS